MRHWLLLLGLSLSGAFIVGGAACGGDNGTPGDGGSDATLQDGALDTGPTSDACWNGCTDGGSPTCVKLGLACQTGADCCSGTCNQGACQPPACASDNAACTSNSDCCSGTCGSGGTCTPLNTSCKTLGNACNTGTDCCSGFCQNKVCSQPSYCAQNGDLCAQGSDCCGAVCTKQPNAAFGVCGQPTNGGCTPDGMLCSGTAGDGGTTFTDGGVPKCGGSCCSRSCAPWGPNNVLICQPVSGCRPVGDICYSNADCCGGTLGSKDPGRTVCDQPGPGQAGTCGNPNVCSPNGDVCKLYGSSCNASSDCCSGNTSNGKYLTCHQDSLGVPRCSYDLDGGTCTPSGGSCASSADCCNLSPCVPDADGGFTCFPQACVPAAGACTVNADCCPGGTCYIPSGQTTGSCTAPDAGPDAAPTCAAYGQTCQVAADCCNGVPCTNGRCEIPPPQ